MDMTARNDRKPANRARRRFLKATAAALGATATVAFPQVSRAATTRLKVQSSWGATSPFQDMAKLYVDRVERMSGGRLRIDLLPSGAVVKSWQVQDACHQGLLDGAHSVTAYWYGKHKAAVLFGTGPVFGADAAQMLAWFHGGGGKELYRELIQDVLRLNIVGFLSTPLPAQPLGWFKKPITGVADLQGLKYRTVGLATDIMQGMGLKVTQLPGGEIVPALERGVIEAFEFNNPMADRMFGAQDVLKHYMLGSYHQAREYFEIIFNRSKFRGLPNEQQAILEHAAEAANSATQAYVLDNYSRELQNLIRQDRVNAYRTPESVFAAQLESWDSVLAVLNRDPFFRKVHDSQKAWAERVGFYELMNAPDYRLAYDHYFPGRLPGGQGEGRVARSSRTAARESSESQKPYVLASVDGGCRSVGE